MGSKDTIRLFMGESGKTGKGDEVVEIRIHGNEETLFRKVYGDFIEDSVKQMIQLTVGNIINKLIECVKFFIYMKSYIRENSERLNVNDNLYKSLGSLLDQYRYPDGKS